MMQPHTTTLKKISYTDEHLLRWNYKLDNNKNHDSGMQPIQLCQRKLHQQLSTYFCEITKCIKYKTVFNKRYDGYY